LEKRKATEVLLDIESKIDQLVNMYKTLSFNISILSNKLNKIGNVIVSSENTNVPVIESVEKEQVEIKKENALPLSPKPILDKRNDRFGKQNTVKQNKNSEIVLPKEGLKNNSDSSKIVVVQRIVDKNGKSVFLADVDISNVEDNSLTFKARTNGAGKWQAQLPPGTYKVLIRKREALSQTSIEFEQTVYVDNSESILNLDMIVIK